MTHHRATLEVDLSALTHNYRLLKTKLNGHACGAVVKANAYGLGVEAVSQALWADGCRHFFVATLAEGIELRGYLPEATVHVFNGAFPGEEKEFMAHRLIPVLNSMEQIGRWEKSAPAILHVDTGMTRLGLCQSELEKHRAILADFNWQFVMSHLACANDPEDPKNAEQLGRFNAALQLLPGVKASLANSSGVFLSADYHYDLARPGCALYGITPVLGENPMRHVATLSAPILQIRALDHDETVGYSATYPAKGGGRIAIAALGYADGYMRHLSNHGFAYIAGHKVPVAGRVSMDMTALDISSVPEGKLNGALRAEFINAQQTVNEVTRLADTIGYEIFTRIGRRVHRLYR
jgi:alanine racemase